MADACSIPVPEKCHELRISYQTLPNVASAVRCGHFEISSEFTARHDPPTGTTNVKLLVTGGAGFIGSAVIRHVLAAAAETTGRSEPPSQAGDDAGGGAKLPRPTQIVNVDALKLYPDEGLMRLLLPHSERHLFLKIDIGNFEEVASVFAEHRPDAVMHLAAETHVDHSITHPHGFIQSNVIGTYNLLQAALGHWTRSGRPAGFRFHHVSTDEVFGRLGETGRFSEDSPYNPCNPYSATKAASDHLVRSWHETYGLPVVISNCSNNFGPGQFPDKLIPKAIARTLDGRPIPVYGSGEQSRDWIYVADHAAALLEILTKGRIGRSYNVGAESEHRNIDVVRRVCEICDRLHPGDRPHFDLVAMVRDRPGHDFRYAIEPKRIRDELGWRPLVSMDEGLEATVRWYIDNQDWWRPLVDRTGDEG